MYDKFYVDEIFNVIHKKKYAIGNIQIPSLRKEMLLDFCKTLKNIDITKLKENEETLVRTILLKLENSDLFNLLINNQNHLFFNNLESALRRRSATLIKNEYI